MTISMKLESYLVDQGVEYEVLKHQPTWSSSQTAQASHVSGNRIAKGVVLKDAEGYLMAVLPASCHIHFNKLQSMLGRDLDMATEEEAVTLFKDCEPGAFPAVGAAYGLEMVVDESLDSQPDIFMEGGDHASLLHISAEQFHNLMSSALHGSFSFPA